MIKEFQPGMGALPFSLTVVNQERGQEINSNLFNTYYIFPTGCYIHYLMLHLSQYLQSNWQYSYFTVEEYKTNQFCWCFVSTDMQINAMKFSTA